MTADIKMYGADWCGDCRRAKAYLDSKSVPYEYIDLVEHPEAKETAEAISGKQNIPVLVFSDGSFLSEPSNAAIEEKL